MSYNPSPRWALQVSVGALESREQLHAGVDVLRMTASAIFNKPLARGNWQTTLAWGRNERDGTPSHQAGTGALSALLLESTVTVAERHTFFGRWELSERNELFLLIDTRHGIPFDVTRLSVGYVFDLPWPRP